MHLLGGGILVGSRSCGHDWRAFGGLDRVEFTLLLSRLGVLEQQIIPGHLNADWTLNTKEGVALNSLAEQPCMSL